MGRKQIEGLYTDFSIFTYILYFLLAVTVTHVFSDVLHCHMNISVGGKEKLTNTHKIVFYPRFALSDIMTQKDGHTENQMHSLIEAKPAATRREDLLRKLQTHRFSQVVPDYSRINWVRGHIPLSSVTLPGRCRSGHPLRDSK